MGIYFGTVYKKTNNLWIPIILHFIMSLSALPYCYTSQIVYPIISMSIILPTFIILGIYSIYIMKNKR